MKNYAALIMLLAFVVAAWSTLTAQAAIEPVAELKYERNDVLGEGAWSPSGERLAIAFNDEVRVYDRALTLLATLHGHTNTVTSVDWQPDGMVLTSASTDATVRVWTMDGDLSAAIPSVVFAETPEPLFQVRWSPDGTMIAGLALDSELKGLDPKRMELDYISYSAWIWDAATGDLVRQLESRANAPMIMWSPDSALLAVNGTRPMQGPLVVLWNVETGVAESVIMSNEPFVPYVDMAWQPDGGYIAFASLAYYLFIYETKTYRSYVMAQIGFGFDPRIAWSADGEFLAAGDYFGDLYVSHAATTVLALDRPKAHDGQIHDVGWSSGDHPLLFTLSNEDDHLRLWSLPALPDFSGQPTATLHDARPD